MVQIILNTEEKQNLYNDMVFVRNYQIYLLDIYNELLQQQIIKTDNDNYKILDNNDNYTEKKRYEANKYILETYLKDDINTLNKYNKIVGHRKNNLCCHLQALKTYQNKKWYDRYKILKAELIKLCSENFN